MGRVDLNQLPIECDLFCRPVETIPKKIYLLISFCHLLIRACSVCLTAADVYDKSKAPISTLFSVPSSSYNVEVRTRVTVILFTKQISLKKVKLENNFNFQLLLVGLRQISSRELIDLYFEPRTKLTYLYSLIKELCLKFA